MLRLSAGQVLIEPGQRPVRNGAVLISGDRIVAAGPQEAVPSPDGSRQLSFAGCTALPGLIDSHVHLTLNTRPDCLDVLMAEDDEALTQRALDNARRMAVAGITTVLDLGARDDTGFAIAQAAARHPWAMARVLTAGSPITPRRGHTWFFGGEADGVKAVTAAVRARAECGAALIKMIATGGAMTAGTDPAAASYPGKVLAAAAREAHSLGLSITAHAHGVAGIRAALVAGLDAVEHVTMMGPDGQWQFDTALARQMAAIGIRAIPTAAAGRRYERSGASWVAELPGKAMSSETRVANAARLTEAGVPIVAGTDAGVAHTDFADGLFCELEAYVDAGMTPADAIRAATATAAVHLGLQGLVGMLHVGHSADVLVVAGDPLSDITALRRTRLVVRAGRPAEPIPPPAEPPQPRAAGSAGRQITRT
jgi:imidazolonepropionase-like amidohydrolase